MPKVKNWASYQHYKNRRPPWIKLYRDLLDDIEYHNLNPESAKYLILIWLIASESPEKEGELPDPKTMAFRLRLSEDKMLSILSSLGHWLTGCEQDASKSLAKKGQDARAETEKRESRDRVEKRQKNMYPDDFTLWWKNYPKHRRVKKQEALKVWKKSNLSQVASMIVTLKKQCASSDWTKAGGKYVPHPVTYLRGGRWEDEITEAPRDEKAGYNKQQLANFEAREELLRQDREAEMQEFKDETDSLPFS